MKCPKCGFISFNDLDQCKQCGADWSAERERLGIKKTAVGVWRSQRSFPVSQPEPAAEMEPERASEPGPVSQPQPAGEIDTGRSPEPGPVSRPEPAAEIEAERFSADPEPAREVAAEPKLSLDAEFDQLYALLKGREQKPEEPKRDEIKWAGFFRRAGAFFIDSAVLTALSVVLFYLLYVGATVGLAAHGRYLNLDNLGFFVSILLFSWVALVSGYFVLLHGLEGKTVGKWLLGVRVVAANQAPITYGQALARWLAYIPAALSGLGLFWIVPSREKRGWHDLVARTWVIRDWASSPSVNDDH